MKASRLTLTAILSGVALIIFVAEAQLPPLAPIPGIKLGLSNIITLMAIYMLGRKEAFAILAIRITLGSIFAGTFAGFLYSVAGGIVSFAFMSAASLFLSGNRMWVTSVFGAIGHNIGQITIACFVVGSARVLWYLPVLTISALITGVFTGAAAQFTLSQLKKANIYKDKM